MTRLLARLPFTLHRNHIFVQVRLNKSDPLWFFFDTGAQTTVIDKITADLLGLDLQQTGGRVMGAGAGGQLLEVSFARNVSMQIADLTFTTPRLPVIPLGGCLAGSEGRISYGILGYDLIRAYVVEIDYAGRTVDFYDPQGYHNEAESLPMRISANFAHLQGSLHLSDAPDPQGAPIPVDLVIDTGCRHALVLSTPFVERRRLLDGSLATLPEWVEGAGGMAPAARGMVASLDFGGYVERRIPALFSLARHGAMASGFCDGMLGGEILRRFTVVLDYPHGKLYLTPNASRDEPYAYDLSGLLLSADGSDLQDIRVKAISEGRPGARDGLVPGDRLLAIDDRPVAGSSAERRAGMTLEEVYGIFTREGSYALTVQRGDELLDLSLTLRDELKDGRYQSKGELEMSTPDQPDELRPLERPADIRTAVRQFYGDIADRSQPRVVSTCCGSDESAPDISLEQISTMYVAEDLASLPEEVTGLSLGCGDPVTLAALQPGQTVLDLGSGGGIDCFLAARRVGPTGRVIGVDMTASMIEKARANQVRTGLDNVEFRLGEVEHLPVADQEVDVIISNCVINLSPDKPQVFREAYRVLKPGGLLAVSDIMTDGPLPEAIRNSQSAWAGCVGGALEERDYLAAIGAAGFVDVEIERAYMDDSCMQADLEALGLGDEIKDGRHAVIRVGDHVEVVDLGEEAAEAGPVRAFSGKVKARKPSATG